MEHVHGIAQGYSNGGPQSASGPLDGDGRTLSASQRCILYPEVLIPKSCTFVHTSKAGVCNIFCRWAI